MVLLSTFKPAPPGKGMRTLLPNNHPDRNLVDTTFYRRLGNALHARGYQRNQYSIYQRPCQRAACIAQALALEFDDGMTWLPDVAQNVHCYRLCHQQLART